MTEKQVTIPSAQSAGHVLTWEVDGKEMIYIPGSEFVMGSDEGRGNEQPAHKVVVAAFYLTATR